MSETPLHRHRPLLPVALVVRLPRRHETPSLVSQVVPIVGEGSVQIAATGTALVEWAGGAVSFTRDVEGLEREEQARRQHFVQLCDAGVSEGFDTGNVMHSRFLPRCETDSGGDPQGAAPSAPLAVQAISRNQLKRLRNWASNQGLRHGPRPEGPSCAGMSIGATSMVSALERAPWSHNRSSMLTAAQSAPGANVRERCTESGNGPTLVVEVQRADAPHDARQVPLRVLARWLHAAVGERGGDASVDEVRQSAVSSVRRCLDELLLSRLIAAAELRVLGLTADGDSSARTTFRRLFVWYESFTFPEPEVLECLSPAAAEPIWSEAGALAALQGDPEPLQRAFSDPSGLPHVRDTLVIGTTANQRTGSSHRSSTRAAALSEVLTVSLRLKRTPIAYELVRRK